MSDQDKHDNSFADAAVEAIADIMSGKNVIVTDTSAAPLPPGEHVVFATVDTTQPTAPENIFMPTENPDGTWTTKITADHPAAGVVFGRTHDRAISPDEAERRVPIVMAASHIRDILLGFPAFQRADVLAETGLCRDCGTETDGRRCHCMNDE